jgi:mannose/cellobiose epimerase-like protein (N-acyl-D-glucosamine 2-epimerase family)
MFYPVKASATRSWLLPLWIGLLGLPVHLAADPTPFQDDARSWRNELRHKIMPYWYDTAQDLERGGYLLADSMNGRGEAQEKQLVSQTRMIWTFAHVHRLGLGDAKRDWLEAAAQGYRFLQAHFLDPAHGGYYWKTDLAGKPIHDAKFLYGQSFVIYALVEYHRASGDAEPLHQALTLYRLLQRKLHDTSHGGWLEHTEANWLPLKPGDPRNEVEVVGLKSANAHLHWMEALTELYEVSRDPDVRASLAESLDLNARFFYPLDAGQSCFHRQPNWEPVTDPQSAGLSYGHNVEFAWLMIRAEQVLGRPPSWNHFYAHVDHALDHGYDHQLGGLYNRGFENQPASDQRKIWWVQAEMLAALTDSLAHQNNPRHERALRQLINFIRTHQVDPRDGVWLDTVRADGRPENPAKAHNWKANYHDVRAIVKFILAFDPEGSTP